MTKYYFAGATRIAMHKYTIPQPMTVEYFLGDHLGSTSITTDANGAKVSEMRYKPWGEVRSWWTASLSTTPAQYTFTGQFSHMDDPSTAGVTEGFGLMFYVSRMYDPALGRFIQADSIVPGGVQGLDRYAYVNNSPINYTDPSGHVACRSKEECNEMGTTPNGGGSLGSAPVTQTPPLPKSASDFEYSYTQGLKFVNWLRTHDGWWSQYMNNASMMWKFLIALAYSWETNGVFNEQYLNDQAAAFDNKIGYFTSKFGPAGYYIFLVCTQRLSEKGSLR